MTVRWAMIGTGRIHRWMAQAIKKAPDSALTAVLSRDAARAQEFAKEQGIERAFGSLDDLLSLRDLDVVYIASPNALHTSQAIRVAEAGKHVFCEKPMATTVEDCRAMIEACKKYKVRLGLGFQYRQHPAHRQVREIIRSCALGQVILVKASVERPPSQAPEWYYNPKLAGGGVMYMMGAHRLDLLRFVTGAEVTEASAFIGEHTPDRPFEETVVGILRLDNGGYCSLQFCMNIPHGRNSFEIHGTGGSASLEDTTASWHAEGGGKLVLRNAAGTVQYQYNAFDMYRSQVEEFNRCVRGGDEPSATGTDGLRASQIALALFKSGAERKSVVVDRT